MALEIKGLGRRLAAASHGTVRKGQVASGGALAGDLAAHARNAGAGLIAALVTLAHCLSFSALIFAGDLAPGMAMAVWGFMIATALVTLIVAPATTLPPLLAGPRNPAVAVMSVLAAGVAAAAAEKGLAPERVVQHVLVALSLAGVLTGLALWVLGALRLGQAVRFIPYPVIAGFLGASGVLLVTGGLEVGTGSRLMQWLPQGMPPAGALGPFAATVAVGGLLLAARRTVLGAAALPVLIIATAIAINVAVWLGGAGGAGGNGAWHLAAGTSPRGWSPLAALAGLDGDLLAAVAVEIVTIAGVSIACLLLDASSLEVQRRGEADMDAEFRASGAANLAVAAVGGIAVGHALNPSRLIDALGGAGRWAGVAGGALVGLVVATGIDLASLVPRPVLGGLLVFLGIGVLGEALKAPGRRSRAELALTLLIMVAILALGYLTGILIGMVAACLLFAARYSRIDVVRRHVTRAALAAPVERRPEVQRLLAVEGDRIHVLWLAGYLFFGSSNGLYERIRRDTRGGAASAPGASAARRWVVLDCSGVTGLDASAVLSLQKLAAWAATDNVVLLIAAASAELEAELAAAGLVGPGAGGRHFATRNDALEWAEAALVAEAVAGGWAEGPAVFEGWLARELGPGPAERLVARYLERRRLAAGDMVCAVGAPADTLELVAEGAVSVTVRGLDGRAIRVRRMTQGTVVGEMGFFRRLPRVASVVAEEEATVYVMTRAAFERLKAEEPSLAAAFLELVVRSLADRLEAANREIGALL